MISNLISIAFSPNWSTNRVSISVGYKESWLEDTHKDWYKSDPIMNEVSWPTSALTWIPESARDMKGSFCFRSLKEKRGRLTFAFTQIQYDGIFEFEVIKVGWSSKILISSSLVFISSLIDQISLNNSLFVIYSYSLSVFVSSTLGFPNPKNHFIEETLDSSYLVFFSSSYFFFKSSAFIYWIPCSLILTIVL